MRQLIFKLPEVHFRVGDTTEERSEYGSDSVGLTMYYKFQNEVELSISLQGADFVLVFDNVFTLAGTVFGSDFNIVDIQAGFQYAGESNAVHVPLAACKELCSAFLGGLC